MNPKGGINNNCVFAATPLSTAPVRGLYEILDRCVWFLGAREVVSGVRARLGGGWIRGSKKFNNLRRCFKFD